MKFDFSGKTSDLPRVPNYLGGRDRRMVTFWVLGGGFLLLIASNFANFSSFVKAILPGRASSVDTRLPLEPYRERMQYDAVQMLPVEEVVAAEKSDAEKSVAEQTPDEVKTPETKSPESTPATDIKDGPITLDIPKPLPTDAPPRKADHGKHYSAVNVPLLDSIQDRAPFRERETEVWYHLFDVVNKAPPEQLKKEATRLNDFATIFGQSNYYRGQAIAMTGVAKWYREVKSDQPDNAAGIKAYYEIGFQTNPREDNPIIVYVINLPVDLPRGTADPAYPERFILKPGVPMAFEGIFFKNAAYSAADNNIRVMPTLIAKTIRVQPGAAAAAPPTNPMIYLGVLLGLGALLVAVMSFFAVQRKQTKFVIPEQSASLTIAETDLDDAPRKESWPVLPTDE